MVSKFTNSVSQLFRNFSPITASGCWIKIKEPPFEILDLTGGIGALSVGHCHPLINKAAKNQCDNIVHSAQQVFGGNLPRDKLISKMSEFTDKSLNSYYFTTSGSEATDNAIKISRRYTNRNGIIVVKKGFHGRTLGALSLTSSNPYSRNNIGGLLSNVYFCDSNISSFYEIFDRFVLPEDVAGFMFESVQGEGGIFDLDRDFLAETTQFCEDNKILVIADEVQCGMGRTGHYWNIQSKQIVPDILTFGKGISNGYPLAGLVAKSEIIDNQGLNFLGGTYGSNPIMCAAAVATLDVIKNKNVLQNVINMENYLSNELKKINGITDFRIYGLMVAIEIQKNTNDVVNDLAKLGVCVLKAGNKGQYIRLLPPLNICKHDMDIFLNKFQYVLNSN